MKEMTPEEAALFLANLCETTARGTQDWDNMREIFKSFIEAAYQAGQANPLPKSEPK